MDPTPLHSTPPHPAPFQRADSSILRSVSSQHTAITGSHKHRIPKYPLLIGVNAVAAVHTGPFRPNTYNMVWYGMVWAVYHTIEQRHTDRTDRTDKMSCVEPGECIISFRSTSSTFPADNKVLSVCAAHEHSIYMIIERSGPTQ